MSRILVIDDEKNIRKMVRLTLQKAGHEVEEATDGTQGLQIFGDGTGWDLTIVDHRMPGMEGREVVEAARQRDPDSRLMMMTAFATVELASAVMQAGATDFLRKPFSAAVLRGAVQAALERPRQSFQVVGGLNEPAQADGLHPVSSRPPISYYLNGFNFWPVARNGTDKQLPSMEISRIFLVQSPGEKTSRCLVGLTTHVREQVREEAKWECQADDPLWEMLCQMALSNYLWNKAAPPPDVLPVFDLTPTQLATIRSLDKWNPFTNQ